MKSPLMQLATIRIRDTEILSLACARLDAHSGGTLIAVVAGCIERGVSKVVLDIGPVTFIDAQGAQALGKASAMLGGRENLALAGLNVRARAELAAACVGDQVQIVEWWTDALESMPRAA